MRRNGWHVTLAFVVGGPALAAWATWALFVGIAVYAAIGATFEVM